MAPKEKRRNSEKRKEKSRDAARCRRSKESEIFTDMANLLPVPPGVSSQLDKASVMRLTIAYLKTRSLLDGSCWPWSEPVEQMDVKPLLVQDSWLSQAMGGVLMAMSPDGDIAYLTDNVTQHLGLPQVDMIGHSIYDFSHPCDHDDLREALSLRPDREDDRSQLSRSFFLRFKSTLSPKGRSSSNLKSASYKVMNCTGRIVLMANAGNSRPAEQSEGAQFDYESDLMEAQEEDEEDEFKTGLPLRPVTESYAPSHFLVLIAEPIPHPSNIDTPMEGRTFLTKNSLDMRYTLVDDKIAEFLGYSASELEGRSAYELHHALDHDIVYKSYKTMFAKGQVQTPPYRFLARRGGYAWVQTQATLVYGSCRDSTKPQAVVCVHTCLGEIEEDEAILCSSQAAATVAIQPLKGLAMNRNSRSVPTEEEKPPKIAKKVAPLNDKPQKMTAKLFHPRTADMNSGFLMFDEGNGKTVFKEEPEDLTHLAPTAGDSCIPLDVPNVAFPADFLQLDLADLTPDVLDCFPLTGFEFPSPVLPMELGTDISAASVSAAAASPAANNVAEEAEGTTNRATSSLLSISSSASAFKDDPFLFFGSQNSAGTSGSEFIANSSPPTCSKDGFEEVINGSLKSPVSCSKESHEETDLSMANITDDEEELSRRAPFIPMNDDDDLPIFDPTELFSGLDLDASILLPLPEWEDTGLPQPESALVKLLKTKESVLCKARPARHPASKRSAPSPTGSRASSSAEESDASSMSKRPKEGPALSMQSPWTSSMNQQSSRSVSGPVQPPIPSRARPVSANTSSLMELLTDVKKKPLVPVHRSLKQSTSVLENLLGNGSVRVAGGGADCVSPAGFQSSSDEDSREQKAVDEYYYESGTSASMNADDLFTTLDLSAVCDQSFCSVMD